MTANHAVLTALKELRKGDGCNALRLRRYPDLIGILGGGSVDDALEKLSELAEQLGDSEYAKAARNALAIGADSAGGLEERRKRAIALWFIRRSTLIKRENDGLVELTHRITGDDGPIAAPVEGENEFGPRGTKKNEDGLYPSAVMALEQRAMKAELDVLKSNPDIDGEIVNVLDRVLNYFEANLEMERQRLIDRKREAEISKYTTGTLFQFVRDTLAGQVDDIGAGEALIAMLRQNGALSDEQAVELLGDDEPDEDDDEISMERLERIIKLDDDVPDELA